ncbi:hypothetical protein [Streptomyces lasiicapitis]|uniref:hypothetical protein n=1 Tax=Streptomyces lasiicapitis TaxID=1923961 RepID=UPI003662D17B
MSSKQRKSTKGFGLEDFEPRSQNVGAGAKKAKPGAKIAAYATPDEIQDAQTRASVEGQHEKSKDEVIPESNSPEEA